ncbi:hypothetical protein NH340_JMT01469 [Sarcoptes scabiei]|nr:hypothetical protein NH340_JMT01469 [Sarcoptes scabiei]
MNTARTSTTSTLFNAQESFLVQKLHERNHSPSPTEFYRNKFKIQTHLWEREHHLNRFNHDGIQKFLDKQAVRDLIEAYDLEHFFINGEEHFYIEFDREFKPKQNDEKNSQNEIQSSKIVTMADLIHKEKIDTKFSSKRTKKNQSKTLFNFFTTLWVELFDVRLKHKLQEHRESIQMQNMNGTNSDTNQLNQANKLFII